MSCCALSKSCHKSSGIHTHTPRDPRFGQLPPQGSRKAVPTVRCPPHRISTQHLPGWDPEISAAVKGSRLQENLRKLVSGTEKAKTARMRRCEAKDRPRLITPPATLQSHLQNCSPGSQRSLVVRTPCPRPQGQALALDSSFPPVKTPSGHSDGSRTWEHATL